jgi:multicomponent Na+:H+ antiporter subunit E
MTRRGAVSGVLRAAWFALLWAVLTGADFRNPLLALSSVGAAIAASLWLWPPGGPPVRWRHLPTLVAYFLWRALVGGVDVARRALSPAMPLEGHLVEYDSRLGDERARVLFAWMIGLMPGTACVGLEGSALTVHVIDRRAYDADDLRALEIRLAAVFTGSRPAARALRRSAPSEPG